LVIIPIISLKGGVGKTTVSINLADLLATNKYKVLLIDTDPQNSVASLLCKKSNKGLSEVLRKEFDIDEVIIKISKDKDFFIIPAGEYAITRPIEYEKLFTKENMEKIINSLKDYEFDFVIFDTAPRISKPLNTLLDFANFVLVVLLPLPASIASFDKFLKYLKSINFSNYSVVVNKMEANEISEDFYSFIQSITNNNILTTLPKDLKVVESEGNCIPISSYAPNSAFVSFLKEGVKKMEKLLK